MMKVDINVYIQNILNQIQTGCHDNDDEENSENEEKDKNVKEIPQDINDIKIKTNNIYEKKSKPIKIL